jgi:hypothetical protein
MPPVWLLVPVALAAMAGVYLTFRTLLGRDAGVAMLVLLLAFKLLEMHAKRDLFVVVFLSFFVLLTNFLYSQSIPTALYVALTLVVLLTAQLSFQYTGAVPPLRQRLRTSLNCARRAAGAADVCRLPAHPGPLWGLPGDALGGKTGLSDSMAPGTLSSLAQSDEVAFRVRFLRRQPSSSCTGAASCWATTTAAPGPRAAQARPAAARHRHPARGRPLRYETTSKPATRAGWPCWSWPPQLQLPGHRLRDSDEMECTPPIRSRAACASAPAPTSTSRCRPASSPPAWRAGWNCRPASTRARWRWRSSCAQLPHAGAAELSKAVLARFRTQRLPLHAGAAAAGPRRGRRVPVRQQSRLLRALRRRLRGADARHGRGRRAW